MTTAIEQYRIEHESLMCEWHSRHKKKGYTEFVRDGIVNPSIWFTQKQRILFLLKEAYNDEKDKGKDWDLVTDYIAVPNKASGRIWNAVAEWYDGLSKTTYKSVPRFDNWLHVEKKNIQLYHKAKYSFLQKCSIVNIKKSNGLKTSSDDDLCKYVEEDADLLKRQIALIDPTVIVCGSTFHLVKNNTSFILGADSSQITEDRGCYHIGGKDVIAFYHPSNHYPSSMNFYGLVSMYHHYLKEQ